MRRCQRGQVLVMFAGGLFALIGFAALGIDVGYMYTVRHELQRCADAGALAGASAFFDGPWADAGIRAIADARARDFASRDKVGPAAHLDPASDVAVDFPQADRIRVTTQRTVNLFFARVLGQAARTINATAVAQARMVSQQVPCIKPWGIPFPYVDNNPTNGNWDSGEDVNTECPDGGVALPGYFCPGSQVILKIGTPENSPNNPDNIVSLQQEAGHFFALDFGSGAKTYDDAIKDVDCSGGYSISVGDEIPLKPGNMVGPTYQAVEKDQDSLIALDPLSQWNYAENLPESPKYPIEGGLWMSSPRVVRIAIYDPSEPLRTGATTMKVAALVGFWIEKIDKAGQQGTVYGRFVKLPAGAGVGGPDPGSNGPELRILSLVE